MRIAVLGTGIVGRTLAARLSEMGHAVVMGTRDVAALMARTEPDGMGNPPFATWAAAHPGVTVTTFAEAARDADLLVNATSGTVSLDMLAGIPGDVLHDAVMMDTANPLDFSGGFPPTLTVKDTDSLGEQIQRAHPSLRVVKALNTMTAALMVEPMSLAGGDHATLIAGDDAHAKAIVTELLHSMGHAEIVDLGDITGARGMEMWLPLWLRLMGVLGTPMFNLKLVR